MADPGFPVGGGGGAWTRWGGVDLQRGCFLAKMYAKMKEFGPTGGRAPGTPPRSANDLNYAFNMLEYFIMLSKMVLLKFRLCVYLYTIIMSH